MATYLILNLIFFGLCLGVLLLARWFVWNRAVLVALVVVLICTAIFDSFIIVAGIVAYDETQLLGVYIGRAPIEDFFYAILAAILIPSVWEGVARVRHHKNSIR